MGLELRPIKRNYNPNLSIEGINFQRQFIVGIAGRLFISLTVVALERVYITNLTNFPLITQKTIPDGLVGVMGGIFW
jgi:hypothetical protein